MTPLHLTVACEDYDRTRPFKDGIVKAEGLEVNYLVMPVEEIFWRMMKYEEFDVSELSMGAFLTAAAHGRKPFVAIPVFPSRTFRHRCIFVNTTSGIQRVEDLRGKRMGVPEYSMTAAVWLRGLFQHEYGVPPSEIHWVQAGEEHPGRKDRVDFEMPAGVTLESRPDTTLNAMIEKKPERMVVDLSDVTYIDSAGLASLIEAMQKVESYGGKFVLAGLQETVRSIFEISRLDQVFQIFPDADAALRN